VSLEYVEITESDLPELTEVMTRAFDDDTRIHLGEEKGGPDGYDNGEFFRTWLFPYKESRGFKIVKDGRTIGAFIVWILPKGENNLGTIFIDPDFQNQGVGTATWKHIESMFPETKSWTLGTPSWSTKNHQFYVKKCGFKKISEEEAPDHPGMIYIYRKEISDSLQTHVEGEG
jgi:GNAT superfamily N-acetyltransferase